MDTIELKKYIARYNTHFFRNDKRLIKLDNIGFLNFLWSLKYGSFDVFGMDSRELYKCALSGNEIAIEFINSFPDLETIKNTKARFLNLL